MSLRKRLFLLLSLFGLYAVLAAAAAIYGSQLWVRGAAEDFQRMVGQSTCLERLEFLLEEQMLLLRQVAASPAEGLPAYSSASGKWTEALQQCTSFATSPESDPWFRFRSLAEEYEGHANTYLQLLDDQRRGEAESILKEQIQNKLIPELRNQLVMAKTALSEARDQSARGLAKTSSQALLLTLGVGVLAAVLVLIAAFLVHRWLIRPISELHATTRGLREGKLDTRSTLAIDDELGELANALNEMAGALAASEKKHLTLFANLRDAVVICNREETVLECHDGDTRILGIDEQEAIGRPLLQVWPEWRHVVGDWPALIRATVNEGRRAMIHDVRIASVSHSARNAVVADFVIYRVDTGREQCAAIAIRDATQRHGLQERLHHAETMEALGTMAGGLAHDVNNLLSSVMAALSSLSADLANSDAAESLTRALRSVRRAAGLTKRLLNFAQAFRGTPRTFSPAEVVDAIVDSFEPPSSGKVTLERHLDRNVRICMDQDQFAQIVLNLLSNALEALPEGGAVTVDIHEALFSHPDRTDRVEPFAVLSVCDNGVGMPPEVESRMFEPFFTTKGRAGARGRGMGLAVVYAGVRNAGGFVQVETRPNMGTTVRVYLPIAAKPEPAAATASAAESL